jgi:hypothetical protein
MIQIQAEHNAEKVRMLMKLSKFLEGISNCEDKSFALHMEI